MTTNSNTPKKSESLLPAENQKTLGIDRNWFLALAVLAFLTPFIVIPFLGVYWGAGAATFIFVVWAYWMPTTCMNGGLLYSFIATMLLVNAIFIVIFAILRLSHLARETV